MGKLFGGLKFLKVALIAAVVAMLMPVAAFAQATPMAPGAVITLATDAAADIIDPVQVTYVVLAAVGVSFAFWFVRRSLKLGR